MKIKDFINEFKSKKIMNTQIKPNAVVDFICEKIEIKKYLPFEKKRELCYEVLEASCTQNGAIIEVDSVSRYIIFTIKILTEYTNLEFENTDGEDPIDQYDMLCENGLLNPILGVIAVEYEKCNDILNMMMADIDANNNNVAAVFDKALKKVADSVDGFINTLSNKLDGL